MSTVVCYHGSRGLADKSLSRGPLQLFPQPDHYALTLCISAWSPFGKQDRCVPCSHVAYGQCVDLAKSLTFHDGVFCSTK